MPTDPRLKFTTGTDFDPEFVYNVVTTGRFNGQALTFDEAKRMLGEACHRIANLEGSIERSATAAKQLQEILQARIRKDRPR